MRRIIHAAFVALVVALGIGFTTPSQAVQSLTFSWLVPCADQDGVDTVEALGIELPSGKYVATAVGACLVDNDVPYSFGVTTPCGTTTTGSLPCTGMTLQNIPGAACWTSLGAVTVQPCGGAGVTTTACGYLNVKVSDECLTLNTVGVVTHEGGAMRAVFTDDFHPDNTGAFLVTVTWTPL